MNRPSSRVVRLERASPDRLWWEGRPLEQWPDHALAALIGDGDGRPTNYAPSDDVLRAALGPDDGEAP